MSFLRFRKGGAAPSGSAASGTTASMPPEKLDASVSLPAATARCPAGHARCRALTASWSSAPPQAPEDLRWFIGAKYTEAMVAAYWHWLQEDLRRSKDHKNWFVVIAPEGSAARVLGVYEDLSEAKARRPQGGRIMVVGCERPALQNTSLCSPLEGQFQPRD